METRSFLLTLAVASILSAAGTASAQQAAAPDTSEWTCSKCPFDRGYRSEVELGAAHVDEDSAKFGDYTGLDEKGGYVIANAEGRASERIRLRPRLRAHATSGSTRARSGSGAASRAATISSCSTTASRTRSGTRPRRRTAASAAPSSRCPADWVDAGSTGGMTALDGSLRSVDIGFDRDRYGVAGRYWMLENVEFKVDYRRDQRDGTRAQLASFGSVSTQLPVPVDDATDRLDATVRYEGSRLVRRGRLRGLDLRHQGRRRCAGTTRSTPWCRARDVGQMALAPDNQYHEFGASAGVVRAAVEHHASRSRSPRARARRTRASCPTRSTRRS